MKDPSRILIAIGFLAATSAGGMVYFGSDWNPAVAAVTPLPSDDGDLPDIRPDQPKPSQETPSRQSDASNGNTDPAPEINLPPTEDGFGSISGAIRVSTSILKKLNAYKVIVEENVNTNALRPGDPKPFYKYKTFRVDWSLGTPFFELDEIPFSDHTYTVMVAADGMNGSTAYISVTSHHPTGKDGPVQLALTPGTVYSVLLRTQRHVPCIGMNVHMVPVGESLTRRKRHDGKTNNFGNIVFEDVERGEYMLTVGTVGAPSAPPEKVTVYASAASFSMGRPRVQGKTVMVPDGKNVTIEVWTRFGQPLAGAKLLAWQVDIKQRYEFKGETNAAGRFVFDNVPYGRYQISVDTPIHGRRDPYFEVKKDQISVLVKIDMPK